MFDYNWDVTSEEIYWASASIEDIMRELEKEN